MIIFSIIFGVITLVQYKYVLYKNNNKFQVLLINQW